MIVEIVSGAKWTFKRKRSLRQFVSCECVECGSACNFKEVDNNGESFYQCPDCQKLFPLPQPKWVRELNNKHET